MSAPSVTLPRTVSSNRNAPCGTSAAASESSPGRQLAQVMAVEREGAFVGVEQAQRQVRERRLAGAGRPDDRDRATGRHVERDLVQDPLLIAVPVVP